MAVGVPENDVFAAADAVLARGERPTVERVRLELGRGSPARVGSLLDQWWARLAERLSGETRLPTLPAEVSKAFVAVWQQAIHLAQGIAEQTLSEQRQVLAAERERVAAVEDQACQDAAIARQHAMAAQTAQQVSETRLADLEVLLEQRATQIEELHHQRDVLLRERHETQQQNQALLQDLQALRLRADQARITQDTYMRGVEDRAHREIDRAREEGKATALQLKAAVRKNTELQLKLESVQEELNLTLQTAAAQQARAETLEQQMTRIHSAAATNHKPRTRKKTTSSIEPQA
jgi:hypothetical protein